MKMKYRKPAYVSLKEYSYQHNPKVGNAFGIELEFNSRVGNYLGVATYDASVREGMEFKLWTRRPITSTFERNIKTALLKWIAEIPDLRSSGLHVHFESENKSTLWYEFIKKYQRVFLSFFANRFQTNYVRKLFVMKSEFSYEHFQHVIFDHYSWINSRSRLDALQKHFEIRLMPSTLWWYNIVGWLKFWDNVDQNLAELVSSENSLLDTLIEYCGPFLYEMATSRDSIPVLPKTEFQFLSCDYTWCRKCKHLKLGDVCSCSNVGFRSAGKKYVVYVYDPKLVFLFQDRYSTDQGNMCGIYRTNDPSEIYTLVSFLNYYSENVFSKIHLDYTVYQILESPETREAFFSIMNNWVDD